MNKKATKQKTEACEWCAQGMDVLMLDDDGTRTDISHRTGRPSHASGDAYWPCPMWWPAPFWKDYRKS